MEAFTFNTTELILLSATGVLLIIQLIYYLGLYNRIHTHNLAVGKDEVHFGREHETNRKTYAATCPRS